MRLRLVYALDVAEELCVGDLALALDVSEDPVSYALRLLRTAGLTVTRKQGRVVYNRLAEDFPAPLRDHCLRQLVALTPTPPTTSSAATWTRTILLRRRNGWEPIRSREGLSPRPSTTTVAGRSRCTCRRIRPRRWCSPATVS